MSAGRSIPTVVAVLLVGVLGLAGLALAPAAARAGGRHSASHTRARHTGASHTRARHIRIRDATPTLPGVDTLQLGPLSATSGFSLYVTAQSCGSSDPTVALAYLKKSSGAQLSHTYTGMRVSCSISRRPAGASLAVRVPGLVDIAVTIADPESALTHPGLPVGCGPPYGPELPAAAVGRIDVAIHTRVFGQIVLPSANAQIFTGAPQTCPAVAPTGGRELTADVGTTILAADAPNHGPASLDILDEAGGDTPAPGIQGTLGLQMSGSGALALNAATGTARIGATTALTSGSLSFTPLAACPGASAQNGDLAGALTIEDPLLGPRRIAGADADSAYSGVGSALPGACNGLGAEPVEPELIDTCNDDNAGCSVSAGSAVATLFDETSPGTQTITAETVDFGDGSAPVAIANFGAVQHAYSTPGSYTATLTVTDAANTVSTTTAPVVIDP